MKKTLVLVSLFVFMSFGSVGCGKGSVVRVLKDVKLTKNEVDHSTYLNLNAILNTGKIKLPAITVPVVDPKSPLDDYGSISLKTTMTGTKELELSLNLTKLEQTEGNQIDKLPNGHPIPVGGLNGAKVIGLNVLGNSKVYTAFGNKFTMIGLAIAIRQFDQIGVLVPSVNIFPSFRFKNGMKGVAGIFTGPASGQNGIAIFVDTTDIISPNPNFTLKHLETASQLTFLSNPFSTENESKILQKLSLFL